MKQINFPVLLTTAFLALYALLAQSPVDPFVFIFLMMFSPGLVVSMIYGVIHPPKQNYIGKGNRVYLLTKPRRLRIMEDKEHPEYFRKARREKAHLN